MKKIIPATLLTLTVLSLTGCAAQENKSAMNEIAVEMPSFDHPLGWQIVSMSNLDLVQPSIDSAEETFKTDVLGYRSTEINFNKAHDIGPYDRTVDAQIQDFVFKTSPASSEAYLEKLENAWGVQGNEEKFNSKNGLEFTAWLGESPVYDGEMVLYVTQYTDNNSQKHFVEISSMGTDYQTIQTALKPMMDSLVF